jgi:hypothetical protein
MVVLCHALDKKIRNWTELHASTAPLIVPAGDKARAARHAAWLSSVCRVEQAAMEVYTCLTVESGKVAGCIMALALLCGSPYMFTEKEVHLLRLVLALAALVRPSQSRSFRSLRKRAHCLLAAAQSDRMAYYSSGRRGQRCSHHCPTHAGLHQFPASSRRAPVWLLKCHNPVHRRGPTPVIH